MWTSWKRYLPKRVKRIEAAGAGREPADMGVDIALEATLEPGLPALFDVTDVDRAERSQRPFGTDRRSMREAAD